MKKIAIFIFLFLNTNSFSQSITIEVAVWRHMRAKLDSCKVVNTSEKDSLIKLQSEQIERNQKVINKLDGYVYAQSDTIETKEALLIQLSGHYKKEIKKRKRTGLIATIAATGATIIAVVLKHNYEIQKDR